MFLLHSFDSESLGTKIVSSAFSQHEAEFGVLQAVLRRCLKLRICVFLVA